MINKILRYGLMKRFKRGVSVAFMLTYKCNLSCPYCSIHIPTGKKPNVKESALEELKEFVDKFPYKIREVFLSGGSPELHPAFVEFATWLLDRGCFVKVFTNLMAVDKLIALPKSRRLCLTASYHHTDDWEQNSVETYTHNYNIISKKHRVDVEEIHERRLPYSRVKEFCDEEDLRANNKMIRVAPDLKMYSTCYDMYNT